VCEVRSSPRVVSAMAIAEAAGGCRCSASDDAGDHKGGFECTGHSLPALAEQTEDADSEERLMHPEVDRPR
jgi:hypothetical protein